ncbi:MAG: response regulator [Chloroflexi bacterium]|nr:MAG: response regulator [Chloroflexota bacterium]
MANVLIVDDNVDSQEVLKDILSYHGMAVVGVSNGEEALQILAAQSFDLVVIDLLLPGINGWALQERIKTQWGIPCVAITAYDNQQVEGEVLEAGFIAYYPKPLDATTFAQEIMAIL